MQILLTRVEVGVDRERAIAFLKLSVLYMNNKMCGAISRFEEIAIARSTY